MEISPEYSQNLWPFLLYTVLALVVVGSMVGLSYFLGQRHKDRATGEAFESGIVTTGSARIRFSAQFYIIAMFFVIFDLEAVFIIAWAVSFRETGWTGYFGILVFIGILLVVLIYEWRIGALDWGAKKRTHLKRTRL